MHELLHPLTIADYEFLVGIVEGSKGRLGTLVDAVRREDHADSRAALCTALEREIRYQGSADIAYFTRKALGNEPGVPFAEIVRDVAKATDIRLSPLATDRELVAELAETFATRRFADLSPDEQQQMLVDLGVEKKRAAAFLKRSAGVFAVPVLVDAFGMAVVQGLIKTVLFGAIAKIVGRQIAGRLFRFLFSRLPWWVGWISPAAWTVSIGWTAIDIQGPARRKTIPVVLYLGLCALRERE